MRRRCCRIVRTWSASVATILVVIAATQVCAGEVNPRVLGSYDSLDTPSDICVAGNLAYVATGKSLYIVDVEGPTDPNRPASIVYVDKDATGASTGTSWEAAFTRIQDGIDAAAAMDSPGEDVEVWVAEGRYDEARFLPVIGGHGQNAGSLQLQPGVAVYGGFVGIETARDSRDWFMHETIIDGSRSRGGLAAYHVVLGADDAVIDGFTITGGDASLANTDEESGGGMLNRFCSPTIANCTFLRNKAYYGGGGIANKSANPRIINCRFYGNDGGAHAGGVYNDQSSGEMVNCLFVGNQADEGGAMICRQPAAPNVVNCTLVANQALVGGALFSLFQTEVANSILWANKATMHFGDQVEDAGSAATFSYCSIEGGINGPGFGGDPVVDGGHNLAEDPLFVRMPDPGPDKVWGTSDDDYGDLRLTSISPLIDKGNNAALPADVTTDLVRHARIMGAAVEIGAYEFGGPIDLWAVDLLRGWHELADGFAVDPGEAIRIRAHTLTANPYLHILATFGNGDTTVVLSLDAGGMAYEGTWYPQNAGVPPDGRIDITVCAAYCDACPHDVCVSRWVTMPEGTNKADLIGNDFSVRVPPSDWGTTAEVDFAVLSQGPVPAPATQTAFYLSRDPIIDPAVDVWLGQVDTPVLGATGLHVDTTSIMLPALPPDGFAPQGTCYIGMVVDATANVAEDFEHNNMSRGTGIDLAEITIGGVSPGPDEGVLFTDTFDGPALDLSHWRWVTPVSGPTYSLTLAVGSFRLMTPDTRAFDCWLNVDQMPRLTYEGITGNWSIETRLSVPVSLSGESFDSGIFVRLGGNDYLTHGFTFGGPWLSSARTGTGQFAAAISTDTNTVELRIARMDSDYRFFYRHVGDTQWVQSYELTGISAEPGSVGIFTKTWQAVGVVADFDYFRTSTLPQ